MEHWLLHEERLKLLNERYVVILTIMEHWLLPKWPSMPIPITMGRNPNYNGTLTPTVVNEMGKVELTVVILTIMEHWLLHAWNNGGTTATIVVILTIMEHWLLHRERWVPLRRPRVVILTIMEHWLLRRVLCDSGRRIWCRNPNYNGTLTPTHKVWRKCRCSRFVVILTIMEHWLLPRMRWKKPGAFLS